MGYGVRAKKRQSLIEHGTATITASGTWTVPRGVFSITVFAVGGGAGGWGGTDAGSVQLSGAGGGGGYTKTQTFAVLPNDILSMTIGAGGAAGISEDSGGSKHGRKGGNGGATSVTNVTQQTTLVSVAGGYCANSRYYGGHGGSGGTAPAYYNDNNKSWIATGPGQGGTNGGDGSNLGHGSAIDGYGGTGQGTTTRAFGETTGTLYASGGNSSRWGTAQSGANNTGNGGDGGAQGENGGHGGSGVVLIRY